MPNGKGTHSYANPENFDPRRVKKERPSKDSKETWNTTEK